MQVLSLFSNSNDVVPLHFWAG